MNGLFLVEATPVTGRTHQIRVHAADAGFPIVGDELYGGEPFHRLCLHAHRIKFQHPTSGKPLSFEVPGDFDLPNATQRVASMIALSENNVYRLQHGAADGWPGCYVDRLGDYLLIHTEGDLTSSQLGRITAMAGGSTATGIYQRRLQRNLRGKTEADLSPHKIAGQEAPASFLVRENGVNFELRFGEGYSVGLFLDQRDNRRRVRARHVGPGFPLFHDKPSPQVLNAFAYTCGFSVCAAMAGATVVSVDLSRKYLDWGQRNFVHNNLDPAQHEFIAGDVMDWLGRLRRRRRLFDLVLLDPPTFSNSKKSGVFKADKNYADLIELALPTVKPGGVLFCSTNVAGMSASDWLREIEGAIRAGRRNILQQQYFPQPVDFPITRTEPAYLKTVWLRIS